MKVKPSATIKDYLAGVYDKEVEQKTRMIEVQSHYFRLF